MRARPRLLIIAPQGLGDSLQVTPLLPSLRSTFPQALIDVLTLRPTSTALFAELGGLVDRVIHLPFWDSGKLGFVKALARTVVTTRYDASILAYPAARWEYHLLHCLVRSRCRIAHRYGKASALDCVPGLQVERVEPTKKRNVERNADLFRHFDNRIVAGPEYVIPNSWRDENHPARRPVVVHVGSIDHDTFAAKRWPLPYFIELAERLLARGEDVIYLSGPDERRETREAHENTPGSKLFEGPLKATAKFLDGAALIISNDSGIAHLATGLGRPVLSLFGPTPVEYAPHGASATPLRPTLCPPCFDVLKSDMTCKLNIDYACLRRDLSVDLVERAGVDILTSSRAGLMGPRK